MRFWNKFRLRRLTFFPLPCLYALFWFFSRHSSFAHNDWYGLHVVLWTLVAVIWFVRQNFIYWELDLGCLRQRWLWKKTDVVLQDVKSVGYMNYKRPSSWGLEIDYIHPGPMIVRDTMLVDPVDREQFIAALRQFAPQATFDV